MVNTRKKGFVFDIFVILVLILIPLAFVLILSDKLLTGVQDASGDLLNQTILNKTQETLGVFNTMWIFIVFGLMASTVVLAFMVESHPAMFVFSLILSIILIVLVPQVSNIYLDFATHSEIIGTANQYPLINTVFQNMPLITGGFFILVLIVLFGKWRSASDVAA